MKKISVKQQFGIVGGMNDMAVYALSFGAGMLLNYYSDWPAPYCKSTSFQSDTLLINTRKKSALIKTGFIAEYLYKFI
jgi:hypothetical protein